MGAFTGECYGLYETDFEHFDRYVSGITEKGIDGVREYMERFVFGPASHEEYLGLFELSDIARQQQAARELINPEMHGV